MTPTTCPPPNNAFVYHPPNFNAFTDVGSIGHVALGWIAGKMSPSDTLTTALIFTSYQLSQSTSGESWSRISGELLEFSIGLLIARFTAQS